MAESSETSDYPSIQQRILAGAIHREYQPESLYDFVGNPIQPIPDGLAFELDDYLGLVDHRSYASSAPASCFALPLTSCSRAFRGAGASIHVMDG